MLQETRVSGQSTSTREYTSTRRTVLVSVRHTQWTRDGLVGNEFIANWSDLEGSVKNALVGIFAHADAYSAERVADARV